jgi:ribA/ribD-fused uncharacterized protein
VYPSSEHAYQAAKSVSRSVRLEVRDLSTAAEAKKFGRTIALRRGWNEIKLDVMLVVLRSKFAAGSVRARWLLRTGKTLLVEGNYHGDVYWGVDARTGKGANHLGVLLMVARAELAKA